MTHRLTSLIAALGLVVLLAAQTATAPKVAKKKSQPHKQAQQPQGQQSLEYQWMCKIGSYHNCHCPDMVAEVQKEAERSGKPIPHDCDIIQKPDTKHPEHTCKRTCSHAACLCLDEFPCAGPELVGPPYDDGDNSQQ